MSTSQEKKLPSNRTYTVDDIAAILGIAKSTAYRLVNRFRISKLHRKESKNPCFLLHNQPESPHS